ncbi:MAG: cytochrome c [Pseudomonadota bacterium]
MQLQRRPISVIAALAFALLPTFGGAEVDGLVAEGQGIAETWCATCHLIAVDQVGADVGPSFPSVAAREDLSDGALRAWLTDPHPIMPQFDLSEPQIRALVTYIRSLND